MCYNIIRMSLNSRIRKLDMFKKVPTDFSEGTNRGGFISLLTLISIGYFLYAELSGYLRPEYSAKLTTDELVTRKEMKIHLDIVLHHFPCEIISLDIQDAMMSHSPNLGSVKKYRLDNNGYPLDKGDDFELLREPNVHQQYEIAKQAVLAKRGCRLKGDFTVKQVPGNFHISCHAYQNIYARLRMQNVISTLDMSHSIIYLFFGDLNNTTAIEKAHPQAALSKLNGHKKVYDMSGTPHSYISHYHLQVVPTLYQVPYWPNSHVYQYTYNHNTFEVNHMPSLYFNYHIGGLTIVVKPQTDSLSVFLIKLCAIIGGTYTIAGFIDNALDQMFDDRRRQLDLIK